MTAYYVRYTALGGRTVYVGPLPTRAAADQAAAVRREDYRQYGLCNPLALELAKGIEVVTKRDPRGLWVRR